VIGQPVQLRAGVADSRKDQAPAKDRALAELLGRPALARDERVGARASNKLTGRRLFIADGIDRIAGAAIAADEMAYRSQRLRGLQSLRLARHLIG
jgi:hypothetical protein